MLTENALILVKNEATEGVDPVPTPALNAILVEDLDVKVNGKRLDRNFVRSNRSSLKHIIGAKDIDISFKTELKGSGTADAGGAGDEPEIDPLLISNGMQKTATAESGGDVGDGDITYEGPVSSGILSSAFYCYLDEIYFKILGCYGAGFEIDAPAGEYGKLSWNFKGKYLIPDDTANPGGETYNAEEPPVIENSNFTIGSYAAIIQALKIAVANDLATIPDINSPNGVQGFRITGGKVTGSLNPEAVTRAVKDFWLNWQNGVTEALAMTVGNVAGAIIDITAPALQYESVGLGDREKIRTYELPFELKGNQGDDELKLKFY